MAGPQLQITVNANVAGAVAGLASLGTTADHTFDEIAAGAAAMDRITQAINAAAAAALNAGHSFDSLESNVISTITPLDTLEQRLQDIRNAIGQSATVQGAANLGAQYEVLNRNLAETRSRIDAATQAAVGLSRAFNTVSTSTAGLNRLSPAIRPALTDLRLLPPAANGGAAAITRLRGASGQASAALTDFSRIIQDAPFGIIGIGNNITQLSESFGRLRATSGSTGAALRQLFTSAGGFGGIGLAISAITTAFTFASMGFSAWTRGMGDTKKATDEAKKAVEEFTKTFKSVADVTGEATGSVQGQIAIVQSLASVVTNANKPYDQRAAALRELGQINKSYFGDLKIEEGIMATLTARVNEYTQALVQQAVVKGFEQEVGKLATGLYEQEKALKKSSQAIKNLEGDIAQARATGKVFNSGFIDLQNKLEESTKAFKLQRDAVTQGRENLLLLKDAMGKAVVEGLKFRDLSNQTTEKSKKEDETLKALRKELSGYERQLKDINELRKAGALPISRENDALALQLKIFDTLGKIDAREVAIKAKPELEINPEVLDLQIAEVLREFGVRSASKPSIPVIVRIRPLFQAEFSPADVLGGAAIPETAFDPVIDAIRKHAKAQTDNLGIAIKDDLEKTLANSLLEGIVSAADVFGAAIGDIFSGGKVGESLANAASAFLGIIGGVLQEVGKQIVVTSTLIGALKRALDGIFGPGGEFISAGIGIALIGLGGILKNFKFPAFDAGITSFAGGLALVGETGPELVRLPPGSDVINNRNMGGAMGGIILEPSIKFSGSQFQIMLNRVNKSKAQLG